MVVEVTWLLIEGIGCVSTIHIEFSSLRATLYIGDSVQGATCLDLADFGEFKHLALVYKDHSIRHHVCVLSQKNLQVSPGAFT